MVSCHVDVRRRSGVKTAEERFSSSACVWEALWRVPRRRISLIATF
jgi:hypothetical protein